MRLRSRYDREIFRLAVPALGALAAEPAYILVDTAIVGHLGRAPLAALGLAATALSVVVLFNFLQYGTTAQVARATGAGEHETAARFGAQVLWLSLALGGLLAVFLVVAAPAIVSLLGGEGRSAELAVTYLRIVSIGVPSAFVALGTQGYFRGVSDLRTPLLVLIAGNVLNAVLEVLFVYGFGWGIEGSAAGTAVAQTMMGAAFVWLTLRRVGRPLWLLRPALAVRLLSIGKFLFLRTAALVASFVLAGAVAARFGDAAIGAHQVAFQLWVFLALMLDAVAIAGQIIVGRELGAARAREAYDASVRMIVLSAVVGLGFTAVLLALAGVLPRAFTGDTLVLDACAGIWLLFALMQPLNGVVFALDGILIGAGDGPYLAWSMLVSFAVCGTLLVGALAWEWGLRGVWAALVALIVVRMALMLARFRKRAWLVVGWT
ncbi:MAG: MATE family efflux transporter [Gaiella sp.]